MLTCNRLDMEELRILTNNVQNFVQRAAGAGGGFNST